VRVSSTNLVRVGAASASELISWVVYDKEALGSMASTTTTAVAAASNKVVRCFQLLTPILVFGCCVPAPITNALIHNHEGDSKTNY
jgi:hypothetical protein